MDITPYVESLRRDLLAAAEAAGPEAREVTERLAFALDPAARLAVMEAVAQAAAEITAEMPTGGVDVRLNGRQLDFVVDGVSPASPSTPPGAPTPTGSPTPDEDDEGGTARITLRLPEGVKNRAEEFAARSGRSLNTWLVSVVRAATRDGVVNVDVDLSSIPFLGRDADPMTRSSRGQRRMTGWV